MSIFGKKRIFLDYAGGENNPSAIHEEGRLAKKRLEIARSKASRLLHCQKRDVIFTSGGTESDNLAVLGVFEAAREKLERPHLIITDAEHPAVLEAAKEAERRGAELDILPTDRIVENIRENTVLVSIIYGNNETGALNNVPKLARLIRDKRKKSGGKYPFIHTDATAAYEYLDVDIDKLPADLITLEKALIVRPNVEIRPLILGGGQERGLRSGTEDVSAIERFVNSLVDSEEDREEEMVRLEKLKALFLSEVMRLLPEAMVNTPPESLPHIVSLSFSGKLHEFLAIKLDEEGIAVSTGSSCDANKDEPDKEALRFSFGRETGEREVKEVIRKLSKVVLE